MVRPKINDLVEGIILGLLKQKMSYRNIVKQVKQIGHNLSAATVHRIQHGKGAIRNNIRKQVKVVLLPNATQQLLLTSYVKSVI